MWAKQKQIVCLSLQCLYF